MLFKFVKIETQDINKGVKKERGINTKNSEKIRLGKSDGGMSDATTPFGYSYFVK